MRRKRKRRAARPKSDAARTAKVLAQSRENAAFIGGVIDGLCAAFFFGVVKEQVDAAFERGPRFVSPSLDDGKTVEAEFEVVGDGSMVKR